MKQNQLENKTVIHPVVLILDFEITELDDSQLFSVIEYIKKESIEGVDSSYGGYDTMGVHYDQTLVFGEEALELMGYSKYIEEANKRDLFKNNAC